MTRAEKPAPAWRPSVADVAAIAEGRHGDPFAVLGMHQAADGAISVRAFWPGAATCNVVDAATGKQAAALEKIHPAGFFAGVVPRRKKPFPYRLDLWDGANTFWKTEDTYRFPPILGEIDIHLFGEGRHHRLYEKLGAHPTTIDGVDGVAFAVWAPNARRVSIVGDFNQWDGRRHPMRKRIEVGLWELFIPGVAKGARYKFELLGPDGALLPLKTDPVGFRQELRPGTASEVAGLVEHDWHDGDWMAARRERQATAAPIRAPTR